MAATIRPLRATRSGHLATVEFEIECVGLLSGVEYRVELDHSTFTVDAAASIYAVFADCPMASVDDAPGFRVVTLSNGTTGSVLCLGVTWIGSENAYAAADGFVYGSGDSDYVVASDADGTVTLTGSRTGHLADSA
jgi:hypothetical protein